MSASKGLEKSSTPPPPPAAAAAPAATQPLSIPGATGLGTSPFVSSSEPAKALEGDTPELGEFGPPATRPKAITFSFTDRLREFTAKLARLHIARSAPSESLQTEASTELSYTGPTRRQGADPLQPPRPKKTRASAGHLNRDHAGGSNDSNDGDHDDADEIIVEVDPGSHPYAASSVGSRNHSIDNNSVASASQLGTVGDGATTHGDGTWSEYSQSTGRLLGRFSCGFGARLWPRVVVYFDQRFHDAKVENSYQKENWYLRKPIALLAAVFILLSWILVLALIPKPWSTFDYYSYIGIVGFFSLALPIAVVLDVPRYSTVPWQILLLLTTLSWPIIFIVEMNICGFYVDHADNTLGGGRCGNKDFQTTLYYAAAYPVLGLFALKQGRIWAAMGTIVFDAVFCTLIVPDRVVAIRTPVIYTTFMGFLNFMNYHYERMDRKVFLMRDELKRQYKATQRARHLEFKAGDSKKRFVSYIFHEVRVPLNAASLAVQNLSGEGIFNDCSQDQIDVVDALRGSLGMMAKVLNDVLDFNRMEDGKLICTHNALDFHKVVRSLLVSARVIAQTRKVEINMQLDSQIDSLQKRKVLIGDEMRLRQVMSNLVSNACKFTNPGGSVKIVTELLHPHQHAQRDDQHQPYSSRVRDDIGPADTDSPDDKPAHETLQIDPPSQNDQEPVTAFIRLEVHDTGVGIRRQELIDNRLFSPYVQTDEGRRQGGKGTGLGLALVRHIIKLSGGRLGVKSRRGVGSTFWVELPFGLKNEDTTPSVEFFPQSHSGDEAEAHRGSGRNSLHSPDADRPLHRPSPKPRKAVKKVQIVEDDSNDDGLSDIDVPTFPRTEANTEALKATLKDFGRVFSSGVKDEAGMGSAGSSGDSSFGRSSKGSRINIPAQSSGLSQQLIPSPNAEDDEDDTTTSRSAAQTVSSNATPLASPPVVLVPLASSSPSVSTSQIFSKREHDALSLPARPLRLRSSDMIASRLMDDPLTTPPLYPTNSGSSPPGSSPCTPNGTPINFTKARVLIVDDDKITRLLMSRLVSRMGHTVQTAEDGQLALDVLIASQGTLDAFDLVFLDNQMPVMTGVECVRNIRRRNMEVWACGVTGNAMMEDQDEFYEAGIDRVLTKPVIEADVRDMISMAMRNREPDYFGRETWRKLNTPVDSEGE